MTASQWARLTIATTTLALGGATVNMTWKELQPMPVGVAGGAVGLVADAILYAGGTTWSDGKKLWLRDVRRYDLTSRAWATGPPLPEPLAYGAFVQSATGIEVSGIEVFGGLNQSGSSRNSRRLDRGAKAWSSAGTLPQDSALGTAELVGEALYLLGGCPDAADLSRCASTVWRRDKHDEWTRVTEMPDGAVALRAGAVQAGRIYVFGGCLAASPTAVRNLDHAWRYDPATANWQKLRPVPEPVRGASAVAVDDHRILLVGGYTASEFSDRAWIYNSENDSYESLNRGAEPGNRGSLGPLGRSSDRAYGRSCARILAALALCSLWGHSSIGQKLHANG